MEEYPFIIIGAGPAGMAAAVAYGKGALILEKKLEAGKKLLLSGSGQCNFTNDLSPAQFIKSCRKSGPFLKHAIYNYGNVFFRDLLAKHGCPSFVREDGKVFPVSLKAKDVRDKMLDILYEKGADIYFNNPIYSIRYVKAGFLIKIYIDEKSRGLYLATEDVFAEKVLLACGGSSRWETGSFGDGHRFASALGHGINPIRSALANIDTFESDSFADCAGISLQNIRADFITKTGKYKDVGDLLFTNTGLSGPLILNNSYLLDEDDVVRLHLLPDTETRLAEILQSSQAKKLINALKPLPLPVALLQAILLFLKINLSSRISDLTRQQRNLFINSLQSFDFKVSKVESLATCMSSAGGVLLKEVNPATMESRLIPGLYLAGEVLDYALPTGGFNIQTAFSTGWLAGISARG